MLLSADEPLMNTICDFQFHFYVRPRCAPFPRLHMRNRRSQRPSPPPLAAADRRSSPPLSGHRRCRSVGADVQTPSAQAPLSAAIAAAARRRRSAATAAAQRPPPPPLSRRRRTNPVSATAQRAASTPSASPTCSHVKRFLFCWLTAFPSCWQLHAHVPPRWHSS